MVGVALVAFVSIFAAGVKETIAKAVDDNLKAAFVVQNTDGFSPFSPAVLQRVEQVPGVSKTSPVRFGQARVQGIKGNQAVSGIDPATFNDLYSVSSGAGALRALGPGRIAVSKRYADDHKVKAGDTIRLTTSTGRKEALRVTGVVNDKGDLVAALIVTNRQMLTDFGEPKDAFGMVGLRPGADQKQVQARIKQVLNRQFPEAEALTAKEFTDDVAGQVNQLLVPDLRAARARGDRVAVRDRQHARAVDQRADTRARAPARDRDDAAPGQADRPLRGGDHVADRRRARHRGRGDPGPRCSRSRWTTSR